MSRDSLLDERQFRCPSCEGGLRYGEGKRALVCNDCAARWPIEGGIPCFVPQARNEEYALTGDMAELVEVACNSGWLEALERHFSQAGVRRDYVREYTSSEARADFRFLMSLGEGATVVDVGSGWGNISVAFARDVDLVYSLDTTLANLEFVAIRARQEGLSNVVPILGDATSLPLPPGSCDGVLMVGVLEWVPWGRNDGAPHELQARALSEAFQVLKPGGQLYLGIENRFSFKSFAGFREPHTGLRFVSLLPRALADWYSRVARRQSFREWTYSRRGLERMLRRAGFTTVEFYYPIPSYQNIRYITDFGTARISRFLISRFSGHGTATVGLRMAGLVASLFRFEKWLSPCFSVIARKQCD